MLSEKGAVTFENNPKYSTTFKNGNVEYGISNKYKDDNFCRVYSGERKTDNGIESIHLKVAKEISDNYLLKNESRVLKKISHKSIPLLVDTFTINDGYEANVIRTISRSYSINEIKEVYPDGVNQEHAVWMMDRLLSVIGYLHTNNIIHGGIEPSNILITPHNHNAILIDYVFAIDDANKPGKKYLGLNDFSAPEIGKSSKPHPVTDMYSLGKTIEYIMTDKNGEYQNDVDEKLKNYLSCFTQKEPKYRVKDAWKQWLRLKELRVDLFGSRNQFLPFSVKPNRKKTTSDRFENIII